MVSHGFYYTLLSLVLVIMLKTCESAKILCLYPTPSYSHQQPLLSLSYALAARGHHMTILTTNPSKVPIKNVREYDLNSLYKEMEDLQKQESLSFQKRKKPIEIISTMCQLSNILTESIIRKEQFTSLVRDLNGTKYDLILYEPLFYASILGFGKLIGNPPVVGIGTVNPLAFIDEAMGNPIIPSYIPETMSSNTDHMTLYERFNNLYIELYMQYVMETCIMPKQQEYLEEIFGKGPYTARDLEHNKSLLIVSTDLATMYPRPHQPNTVYVGPLHLQKPSPLPQDWLHGEFVKDCISLAFQEGAHQYYVVRLLIVHEDLKKWMDDAEQGVIYFSLGSNMKGKSVPAHVREMFINAFKQFPKIRVLWKWEADKDLPGRPANVLARKWLPQQSILAHPKVKLFISQVGLQSLGEAINHKVPILGVPMFGDQDFNARKLSIEGAARVLEFTKVSYENVFENIQTILTNNSYKENMERLWRITNDKPMSAMDTAIWWVEYVLRHKGAPHLRPASLDLTWYQLYMIDIFAILVAIILLIIGSVCFLIRFILLKNNKRNIYQNTAIKSKTKFKTK